MLDTLNESLMIVIAAFPKNGRTTVDGRHYVYGCELAASQFRHDPMNPMTFLRFSGHHRFAVKAANSSFAAENYSSRSSCGAQTN